MRFVKKLFLEKFKMLQLGDLKNIAIGNEGRLRKQ